MVTLKTRAPAFRAREDRNTFADHLLQDVEAEWHRSSTASEDRNIRQEFGGDEVRRGTGRIGR
jgi:hypothetical protein